MADESPANKPEEQQPSEHLNIKVTDNNNEVFFKIKRSTQLKKLMDAFCERQGKNPTSVRFLFDGSRVQPTDSPDTVCVDLSISRCGCLEGSRLRECGVVLRHPLPADQMPWPYYANLNSANIFSSSRWSTAILWRSTRSRSAAVQLKRFVVAIPHQRKAWGGLDNREKAATSVRI
jgi:small ubiquitin-related modifier